ncbi:MAG: PTS sugar transporter subunit IIA [Candidatus Riflebacteria bacterium]|nr:PTS sugar transporter subunit IIA [Candidatus Riflebacteria bacterium]
MMQLTEYFKENMIHLDFQAGDKDEALNKMVKILESAGNVDDVVGMRTALIDREKLGTTGVGGGIAIPHARCAAAKELSVGFFRSKEGVNFQAIDNQPVHLVFLLLAPVASGGAYLKLLAKISRLLRSDEFRNSLLEAKTPGEVMEIIREND